MRKSAIVLFVVGLLLEAAAFMGNQADNIPLVLRFISPNYVEATAALRRMETNMTIGPQDSGFNQISGIFLGELRSQNPPEKLVGISVVKVHRKTPYLGFSKTRAREVIPITFELSNGQKIDWNLEFLIARVNELKKDNVFKAAVAVFIIGMITQVIGFAIQLKESRQIKREYGPTG